MTVRPLAELTQAILDELSLLSGRQGGWQYGTRPELAALIAEVRCVHDSVSFLELPEMRAEWVRRLYWALERQSGVPDEKCRQRVKAAWDKFFFGGTDVQTVPADGTH